MSTQKYNTITKMFDTLLHDLYERVVAATTLSHIAAPLQEPRDVRLHHIIELGLQVQLLGPAERLNHGIIGRDAGRARIGRGRRKRSQQPPRPCADSRLGAHCHPLWRQQRQGGARERTRLVRLLRGTHSTNHFREQTVMSVTSTKRARAAAALWGHRSTPATLLVLFGMRSS